jgi:hypothetical protein
LSIIFIVSNKILGLFRKGTYWLISVRSIELDQAPDTGGVRNQKISSPFFFQVLHLVLSFMW